MSAPEGVRRGPARAAATVLAAALLAGGGLALRVEREGERELAAAETAKAIGDARGAIARARRAASAWLPGAAYVDRAYATLREVAEGAEARQDPATALLAWSATRSAALSSRWLFPVHEADRARADAAIARLAAAAPRTVGTETTRPEELRGEVSRDLAAPVGPRAGARAVLAAGAVAWAASVAWLVRHAGSGRPWAGAGVRVAGLGFALGAAAWLAGVLLG